MKAAFKWPYRRPQQKITGHEIENLPPSGASRGSPSTGPFCRGGTYYMLWLGGVVTRNNKGKRGATRTKPL